MPPSAGQLCLHQGDAHQLGRLVVAQSRLIEVGAVGERLAVQIGQLPQHLEALRDKDLLGGSVRDAGHHGLAALLAGQLERAGVHQLLGDALVMVVRVDGRHAPVQYPLGAEVRENVHAVLWTQCSGREGRHR